MDKARPRPEVSIALPVYNGERFLASALDSLVQQTFEDIEIIICDNASTDRTREISLSFARRDPRIRYHPNEVNLGAAPNFNRGVDLASGEFFKWAAHDDYISPNYIAACVAALHGCSDAVLAYGDTQCVDETGLRQESFAADLPSIVDSDPAVRFGRAIGSAHGCFAVFGVARLHALRRTGLHRSYFGSDRALVAELALHGKLLRIPEAVFFNREHAGRSIRLANARLRAQWQDARQPRRLPINRWHLIMDYTALIRRSAPADARNRCLREFARWLLTRQTLWMLAVQPLAQFRAQLKREVGDLLG